MARAQSQCLKYQRASGLRGYYYYVGLTVFFTDFAQGFKAVHFGHVDVEKHYVRVGFNVTLKTFRAVGCFHELADREFRDQRHEQATTESVIIDY